MQCGRLRLHRLGRSHFREAVWSSHGGRCATLAVDLPRKPLTLPRDEGMVMARTLTDGGGGTS